MKTSELTGHALDWAVAKCAGLLEPRERYGKMVPSVVLDMEYWTNGDPMVRLNPCPDAYYRAEYDPSTNWEHGGPIIEREGISTVQQGDASEWVASVYNYNEGDWRLHTTGPTPLIAAMRCYVASKLGDEIEIPAELK
jgi:hypothetical protein